MSDSTEWKKLRQTAQDQGLRVEGGGRRHWKFYRGDEMVCTMPNTPGRGRALLNQKAQLRRAGVKL
jgi:hypothetical protein